MLTCVGGTDHAGRPTAVVVAPQQLKMIFVTEGYHQIDIVLDAGVQVWYRYLLKKSYLERKFHNIVIIIQTNSFYTSLNYFVTTLLKSRKYEKDIYSFYFSTFKNTNIFITLLL